jgi:hypothetical protein
VRTFPVFAVFREKYFSEILDFPDMSAIMIVLIDPAWIPARRE